MLHKTSSLLFQTLLNWRQTPLNELRELQMVIFQSSLNKTFMFDDLQSNKKWRTEINH